MLRYLLDAHLSPVIGDELNRKRPEISIHSLRDWRNGAFRHEADRAILLAAAKETLTLVTYDQRTIFNLLVQFADAEVPHSGVVFIDDRSIRSDDYGRLVTALISHWDQFQDDPWENRVDFLRPISRQGE